jgi:hypothetical protein
MKPGIWGKYGWAFLHLVTLGYPEQPTEKDKIHYYEYFHALKHVLPCGKCNKNLKAHLKKYPLTNDILSSKNNLVRWGIDLHNVVNYYTGKPLVTYEDALNEINKLVNPNEYHSQNYVFYFLLAFLLVIIVVGILWYKKN